MKTSQLIPLAALCIFSTAIRAVTLTSGCARINYNESAWESLASGFAPPPVLTLTAFFNQAQVNALTEEQLLDDAQTSYSYSNQVYAMDGPLVTNLSTQYAQPTTFQFEWDELTNETGSIGLGGVARFAVLGGTDGNLLYGDYTLQYSSSRIALGGTGWYLEDNIPPAAPAFDLLNVNVVEATNSLTISGDLCVTFEVANFLYDTPSDWLTSVGTFTFTGYTEPLTSPVIRRVAVNGGNLVVQATNGLAHSSYTLLSTTNLASSIASWNITATGSFDENGNSSNSIPIMPGEPARFFLIEQP